MNYWLYLWVLFEVICISNPSDEAPLTSKDDISNKALEMFAIKGSFSHQLSNSYQYTEHRSQPIWRISKLNATAITRRVIYKVKGRIYPTATYYRPENPRPGSPPQSFISASILTLPCSQMANNILSFFLRITPLKVASFLPTCTISHSSKISSPAGTGRM